MKKLLVKLSAIVATFVAVFSLTACGGDEYQSLLEKKIKSEYPDSKILKNQEEEAIKIGIKNPKECLKFTPKSEKNIEYEYIFIETKDNEKIILEIIRTIDDGKFTIFGTATLDSMNQRYKVKGISSCQF